MACTVTELNTLKRRYQAHLLRDDTILRRPQRDRGLAICDYMEEINPKTKARNTFGYGVSPTGTGKTTLGCDMIIGMNTLPGGDLVLGNKRQGRRTLIHVPTNLLLDRWEEELLGMPDGKGGRLSSHFPAILPEHVGVYRASDSKVAKKEALNKPIVLITYDSGRMLATSSPSIECNSRMREEIHALLKSNHVTASAISRIDKLMKADRIEDEALHDFFEILHKLGLSKNVMNALSDITGVDFISESARQELREDFLELLSNAKSENPNKTTIAILDETDDRPRGDATRRYVQEYILPQCFTLGLTATHLYCNGRTVGDYIFDGLIPIFETPFQEAVNQQEISPVRNIVFEMNIPEANRAEVVGLVDKALQRVKKHNPAEELDYTDGEIEKMVRLSGIDDAAINILLHGCDPDTKKPYLDMKSVWYCASVAHAESLAGKINAELKHYLEENPDENAKWQNCMVGKEGISQVRYAEAVSGRMNNEEIDAVIMRYRNRDTMALTNNVLMTRGFDDRQAELCFQLCPSRSPNRVMQQGGRVTRKSPGKIANIISFVLPDVEQVIFGQLASGMKMIPEGFEFPSTEGHEHKSSNPRDWVNVENVPNIITNEEEYRIFMERYIRRSEAKPEHMLTCGEMAKKMNPNASGQRLRHETERLMRRLYEPLSAAYNIRQARQKYVGTEDAAPSQDNTLAVRGQAFPVWRVGNYRLEGREHFCIDKNIARLCTYALFGALKERPAEFITESLARQKINGNGSEDTEFNTLIGELKDAYLDRPPYSQSIEMRGLAIPVHNVGFFRKPGNTDAVDFCIAPEVLQPLYQIHKSVSQADAKQWWSDRFFHCKTRKWLNLDETAKKLSITLTSHDYTRLAREWARIQAKAKRIGSKNHPCDEKNITIRLTGGPNNGREIALEVANRCMVDGTTLHFCIKESSVAGMESLLDRADIVEHDVNVPFKGRSRNTD